MTQQMHSPFHLNKMNYSEMKVAETLSCIQTRIKTLKVQHEVVDVPTEYTTAE